MTFVIVDSHSFTARRPLYLYSTKEAHGRFTPSPEKAKRYATQAGAHKFAGNFLAPDKGCILIELDE